MYVVICGTVKLILSLLHRVKCDQYWPGRGTETYGVMCVTLTDTQELATYVIRTFQLQRVSSAHVRPFPRMHITSCLLLYLQRRGPGASLLY